MEEEGGGGRGCASCVIKEPPMWRQSRSLILYLKFPFILRILFSFFFPREEGTKCAGYNS